MIDASTICLMLLLSFASAEPAPGPGVDPNQVPPNEYKLDPKAGWQQTAAPAPGSDEEVIANARKALAEDRPSDAYAIINPWLELKERSNSPLLAQAYLIRADSNSLNGDEFEALYDYEVIAKQYAGTPEYVIAIERELEIAFRYVNGLKRKWFGVRFISADDLGVELLVRTQERLPGSRLAERAGIELADYYYRIRDMELAAEAYQLFLENFPQSAYRMKAMQRKIYASLARFKGPRYDAAPLLDAQVNIRRFMGLYPAQSQQAGVDESLLTRIDESAAQQLLETARWYIRRDDPVSARYVLKQLIAKHPLTGAASEGARVLQERGWAAASSPASPEPAAQTAPPAKEPGQ
jgi:hypothetical protein